MKISSEQKAIVVATQQTSGTYQCDVSNGLNDPLQKTIRFKLIGKTWENKNRSNFAPKVKLKNKRQRV
jgi:hypothetical protein